MLMRSVLVLVAYLGFLDVGIAAMSARECEALKRLIKSASADFAELKGGRQKALVSGQDRFATTGEVKPFGDCQVVVNDPGKAEQRTSLDCKLAEWAWNDGPPITVSQDAHEHLVRSLQGLTRDFGACLGRPAKHEWIQSEDDSELKINWWTWQVSTVSEAGKEVNIVLSLEAYIPDVGARQVRGNNRFRSSATLWRVPDARPSAKTGR